MATNASKPVSVRNMAVADPALFEFITGALKFALNYRHGTVKRPSIVNLMGGGRKGRGLGGLDGAGQAGMILSQLDWLPEHRKYMLTAKFMVPASDCACRSLCCKGWRENPEWAQPVDWLTDYVLKQGLTGTISHHRLRRSLVARHYGVKESFITLAAAAGINRNTAGEQYRKIHDHLQAEEKFALWDVEGVLKEAGIVE